MSIKRVAAVAAVLLVSIPVVTNLAGAAPTTGKEVLVVNDATQPIPVAVQDSARIPTVYSGQMNLSNQIADDDLVDVPAGKQFVVEYVTATGFDWDLTVEEDVAQVRLTNQGPPGSPFVSVPVERNSPGRYAASEPVLWTVNSDFVVRVDLDQHAMPTDAGDPGWSLAWTISGYLVDAPAA